MAAAGELTPMLRHYLELKSEHRDALLLYRMGDFYELFFEDAQVAARTLGLTLTARGRGTDNEAPMCGVPHHAVEGYVGRLLRAGFRVAICDQMEDPAQAKGLVRREVTRVITPGTVTEPALLEGKESNLLAALAWEGESGAGAFLDVSTGEFFVRRWLDPIEALGDLDLLRPREGLLLPGPPPLAIARWLEREVPCRSEVDPEDVPTPARAAETLARQLGTTTLRGFGLADDEPAVRAAAVALGYAQRTQMSALPHVRELAVRDVHDTLVLDAPTLANLEIFRNQRDGGRAGTLLAVVDRTVTAAGGRLLRDWLRRPLKAPRAIAERQRAVADLAARESLRRDLRARLERVADLERLLARAVLGTLPPREAAALRDSLGEVPAICGLLAELDAELLAICAATDPLADLHADLARTLEATPAAALADGGVIAAGVDPDLDHHRSLARDRKHHILALEARERERTGIGSLKIRYNQVFGYSIEVSRANQRLVPADYVRKQTLVNAERYVTPELEQLEEQVLAAEERQLALERQHFEALRARIAAENARLLALARALARLDLLAAWAELAARDGWIAPRVGAAGGVLRIRDGRHPVVESLGREPFVPNDAELDPDGAQIVILTGPNMGGKSTYLRQVALIVLLAQAGCCVPAAAAEIPCVDRIFTRVGASDDLARGESTFMVEMIETANILRFATAQSLVVLDEVGRGTATFDGLSLAWAIVEFLHENRRPLTLFATHYHELTELATLLPRVVNRTMAVKEWEDRILFLRRVIPGSADKSYGLHVARLAGIPAEVITRAGEVLANLEAKEFDPAGKPRLAAGSHEPDTGGGAEQLALFAPAGEMIAKILRELDVEQLTPLAALNLLHSLKERAR